MIYPNLVNTMLGTNGKPVRSGTADPFIMSAATFAQWYTDVPGVNKTYARTMTLWNNGDGGYVNRWGPNGEQWMSYVTVPTDSRAWCDNTSLSLIHISEPTRL